MSWVAGCLTIENESQKEINRAKTHIRNVVRNNGNILFLHSKLLMFPVRSACQS